MFTLRRFLACARCNPRVAARSGQNHPITVNTTYSSRQMTVPTVSATSFQSRSCIALQGSLENVGAHRLQCVQIGSVDAGLLVAL